MSRPSKIGFERGTRQRRQTGTKLKPLIQEKRKTLLKLRLNGALGTWPVATLSAVLSDYLLQSHEQVTALLQIVDKWRVTHGYAR